MDFSLNRFLSYREDNHLEIKKAKGVGYLHLCGRLTPLLRMVMVASSSLASRRILMAHGYLQA